MLHDRTLRYCRLAITLLLLVLVWMALWLVFQPATALAQESLPASQGQPGTIPTLQPSALTTTLPFVWYLLAAGLALLVPAGFVLLATANLEPQNSWNTALGGLAAAGLAAFAYWAVGFALQFGGVGLVYPHPDLRGMVWEWSPLSSEWGIGWGMAGLTGWFLSGSHVTALAYALFMSHLPWVMLAALLPVMALRGRAPSTVTLILSLLLGGVIYPLAGNWVQGGGWLNALGRNLELGHGFVDYGGAGSVHLVAAGFSLAALSVWSVRRPGRASQSLDGQPLPPAHQPLLAVVGALLILGGGLGWQFANPLQVENIGTIGMMRGAVSSVLAAAGGLLFPLLYTWFVTGSSEPTLSARGFAAGVVAGLAVGPFVQPGIAFVTGLIAGATVPFVTYLFDGRLRLQDRTGVLVSSGVPALIGLLFVGIFADGVAGSGWQVTGVGSYLGVTGQGVSGLMTGSGYVADFPGQIQAQVIGIVGLGLWGFLAGLVVCVPLGLLFHSLLHRQDAPARVPASAPPTAMPASLPSSPAVAVASGMQSGEAARPLPPAYSEPFAAPPAFGEARPEGRLEYRSDRRPAYPPAPEQPLPAERSFAAEPPAPYLPREGFWPDAAPRPGAADGALPPAADPYQALEPVTPPSTAALLDSALNATFSPPLDAALDAALDGAPPAAQPEPGAPAGETTTDTQVAVPVSSQPFIGGSPLTRRRRPFPGSDEQTR